MDTLLLSSQLEDLKVAGEILKNGGLVAFPTETVYGLGANALDKDAVSKVYLAKGRPSDNPMIVHIAEKEEILNLTYRITDDMKRLMDNFWPGPLTMVVPAKNIVPKVTTGGLDTVAVRMPSNVIARDMIRLSSVPIAAPSANLSGKPSPTTFEHVKDDMFGKIDAIIQGENCEVGIESTVVDMTEDTPMVLRPGIITIEDLSRVLDKEVLLDPALTLGPNDTKDFKPKAPGMKYKHYAPDAEVIIFEGEENKTRERMKAEKEKFELSGKKVELIEFSCAKPKEAAHDLFRELREADKRKVDIILITALKKEGVGFSVMNRMLKSAGYNVVKVE